MEVINFKIQDNQQSFVQLQEEKLAKFKFQTLKVEERIPPESIINSDQNIKSGQNIESELDSSSDPDSEDIEELQNTFVTDQWN